MASGKTNGKKANKKKSNKKSKPSNSTASTSTSINTTPSHYVGVFPPEVWAVIVPYVVGGERKNKYQAANLARVCKSLAAEVTPLLYEDIELREGSNELRSLFMMSERARHAVRYFNDADSGNEEPIKWTDIVEYLPNLWIFSCRNLEIEPDPPTLPRLQVVDIKLDREEKDFNQLWIFKAHTSLTYMIIDMCGVDLESLATDLLEEYDPGDSTIGQKDMPNVCLGFFQHGEAGDALCVLERICEFAKKPLEKLKDLRCLVAWEVVSMRTVKNLVDELIEFKDTISALEALSIDINTFDKKFDKQLMHRKNHFYRFLVSALAVAFPSLREIAINIGFNGSTNKRSLLAKKIPGAESGEELELAWDRMLEEESFRPTWEIENTLIFNGEEQIWEDCPEIPEDPEDPNVPHFRY